MQVHKILVTLIFAFSVSCTLSANISDINSNDTSNPAPVIENPTPSDSSLIDLSKLSISVESTYPINGANWNDYVLADGVDALSASDTACNGIQACIHGGEHKKVRVGVSSCSDLKIRDSADAFYWICKKVGAQVVFYSVGLKEGKGLINFIQTNSWINLSVKIYNSNSEVNSAAVPWWTNTITPLVDNSGSGIQSLSTQGTIYTLSASRTSGGYSVDAAKIGIVIGSGAKLSYSNSATNNCNNTTGTSTSPNTKCLITSGSKNYIWIEGVFSGLSGNEANSATNILFFKGSNFLKLKNVTVSGAGNHGIQFATTTFSSIIDTAVAYTPSNSNIEIDDSSDILIARTKSSNADQGLYIYNGTRVRVVQYLALHHAGYPIEFDTCTDCSSVAATTIGSTYVGHDTWASTNFFAHNILAGNNDTGALTATNVTNAYFSQLALFDSPSAFAVSSSSGVKIAGNFFFSNNTSNCGVSTLTTSDFDNSCNVLNGANAQVQMNSIQLRSIIKAPINSDGTNPNAVNGLFSFPAIGSRKSIDWFSFDNYFRTFGIEDASFPSSNSRNRFGSGTGRIYDYRLKTTATAVLNYSNLLTSASSAIQANQNCPAELSADNILQLNAKKYLKNAIEIPGLSIGNNNGLCESGEFCLYTPNYGAYQGEGDYNSNECTFINSSLPNSVKDVKIYFYPANGAG